MKRSLAILMLALMAVSAWGQTAKKKAPAKAPAVTAEDVKSLRDALAAQQQQIEQLRQELRQRDDAFRATQQKLDQTSSSASEAQAKAAAAEAAAQAAGGH